jgi:zinc finger SWIM domain-containing protein 3
MQELRGLKNSAGQYVAAIAPALYAVSYFPGRRYGHLTSNVVESINSTFREERELPMLDMLNSIYHKEMDRRFKRLEKARAAIVKHDFTAHSLLILKEALSLASQYNVQVTSATIGRAKRPQSDIVYIVDLENRSCSCLRFQDTDIPCGHAVALIHRLQKAPADFMPAYVKNRTLINSYEQNFYPIDLADVRSIKEGIAIQADVNPGRDVEHSSESDSDDSGLSDPPLDECAPPLTRASRGRPSKKRKRNGENETRRKKGKNQGPNAVQRAPVRCSTCKGMGHNARTCTQPHR